MAINECVNGSKMIDSRHSEVKGMYCGLVQLRGNDSETKVECPYLNREVVGIVGHESGSAGSGDLRSYQCTYTKS